jgi:hypothetical protein
MSTYFYTKDLSFKDLIDNKELLLKNNISIYNNIHTNTNDYFLVDETCNQVITIFMNPHDDNQIGFGRYGDNSKGCVNILSVIMDLFPNCGLISEYEIYDEDRGNLQDYDVRFLEVES